LERYFVWFRGFPVRLRAAWRVLSSELNSYRLGIWEAEGYRIAYRKGSVDEEVLAHSFSNEQFLRAVPEYEPQADDTIIDVGAHIGTFALLAARMVPNGRVFAVEAAEETFDLLRINVALNEAHNVVAERLLLSNTEGEATLYLDVMGGNWGHSATRKVSRRTERVRASSLARFLEERQIEYCDFMKLNCEGSEFPILLSAKPGDLARIGILLVLYHCDLVNGYTEVDLMKHLEGAGFDVDLRRRKKSRGWLVAINRNRRRREERGGSELLS